MQITTLSIVLRGIHLFDLCYGRHPVSPVNLLSQFESKNEATNSFLRHLEEDVAQVLLNLKKGIGKAEKLCR